AAGGGRCGGGAAQRRAACPADRERGLRVGLGARLPVYLQRLAVGRLTVVGHGRWSSMVLARYDSRMSTAAASSSNPFTCRLPRGRGPAPIWRCAQRVVSRSSSRATATPSG